MRFTRRRLGQTFCGTAIGRLPEDGEVAVSVRLKSDALAVRGPDWKTVVPCGREVLQQACAGEVVDPMVASLSSSLATARRLPFGDTRGQS